MFHKKTDNDVDEFWREYEEKTGEKVLVRSLGRYISGWEEFDSRNWSGIWGLIMTTSGGFRFHHFPQSSWLGILSRFGPPKEKTIFLPSKEILSVRLFKETKWWKKIFGNQVQRLTVNYQGKTGNEQCLLMETDFNFDDLAEALSAQIES